ncbi:nuclear transport factor 2 family protein [Roseivirga sp.]|uniref:nuclear transport factor 2 family protein n=1 Tax=Roseivirga sp. TaxID=1964215 RepID=UPI003B8C6B32
MFNNSQLLKTSKIIMLLGVLVSTQYLSAQTGRNTNEKLEDTIRFNDNSFWKAYNTCDIAAMTSFLAEDLEFYHDKSGLTKGLPSFKKSLETGLCANGAYLERKADIESIAIYPLGENRALISGAHSFSIEGKVVETAKFTHVWKLENGKWKMSRVLSFDHQPVVYKSSNKAINLDAKALQSFVGEYNAPQTGLVTFKKLEGKLQMNAGSMELILVPMKSNMFFHKQSSLTFEFIDKDNKGVEKVIIRENGAVVEEAIRSK